VCKARERGGVRPLQVGTTALRAGKTDHAGRSDEKESGGASEPDWNRAYGGIPVGKEQIGEIPEEIPAVHALRKTSVGAFRIGTTTGAN